MKLNYTLMIERPETHYVKVKITGQMPENVSSLKFFLPIWSPGSYLMREYARHIRQYSAIDEKGAPLSFERVDKSVFELNTAHPELKTKYKGFEISYEIYCHEVSVRTSYVDVNHAFIHGPSVFMGVLDQPMENPELEIRFPALWSKLTTGLKDISPSREIFRYTADNYDDLIDTPIEIGCHETDGFRVQGIDHELAFFGKAFPHGQNLKKDIQTIVETVLKTTKEIPYEKYTFITHFCPNLFGGLEHHNSTALHFCSQKMAERKGYVQWLSLVAHEYFHTWNVKRIRPIELGPFDYLNEAMTKMLWLAEGLTSFMDELFVYRSGLCSAQEYLDMQKVNLNRYISTPGRKFHSLEESSFLSWIKLYRPDENSANSSVSYYLKGGLVFGILHRHLVDQGSSLDKLIEKLWAHYKNNPARGIETHEVYQMVEELAGKDVREKFETMVTTTEEIDLDGFWSALGVEVEYDRPNRAWLGARFNFQSDRAIVEAVELDGPAHRGGLNAGDELIAINGIRVLRADVEQTEKTLMPDTNYRLTVSRLGHLQEVDVLAGPGQKIVKALNLKNQEVFDKYLKL